MITLAILRKIATDIPTLVADENLFWEELPLQRDGKPAEGVWIVTRGGSLYNTPQGINQKATLDLYVAYNNKVKAEKTHADILEWARQHLGICHLDGSVGGTSYKYSNIRINPTTTPTNYGATDNGNIVKVASFGIVYDINH